MIMNKLRQNPQQNLKKCCFCRNDLHLVFSTQIPGDRMDLSNEKR